MKKTLLSTLCLLFVTTFTLQGAFADEVELLGAGATFPYPLYSKMFSVYHEQYGVRVNYQAVGSGGGIRQLLNKTVDFGATDAFMSDEEIRSIKNPILHLPTCLGAVVISYNLPEAPELKLTGKVIADIFLGRITKWNDPQIVALNPQVNLPALSIMPVHRSDASGTTYIFSDYLSKITREWEEKVGRGKALNWPAGLGAKGNTGVAGLVKQIPGAIGYIELTYALQTGMPFALVKNASGNFIKPTPTSVSLAAN
ncbi:phosphate ABC transporter substrate-binding protein PstS, partial [Candidatus Aerophobetes bacterium]|nr:phosphate ABC transporter substrate-binding protein PstS [Candidatus Aerophobetes bacterium]